MSKEKIEIPYIWKFRFSEKAAKIWSYLPLSFDIGIVFFSILYSHVIHCEPINLTIVLHLVMSNLSGKWLQIFVAISENLNFTKINKFEITCLKEFHPWFFSIQHPHSRLRKFHPYVCVTNFEFPVNFLSFFFLFLNWKIENNQFSIIKCCFWGDTNLFSSKQSLINDGRKNTICELTFLASWKFFLSYPPEVMI